MKIGLTGGIGCGKSTVVRFFEAAGWRAIDSDAIVRRLLTENMEVREALRERWGDAVFLTEGMVDRTALAERVFSDDNELDWLEQLLHPLVREAWTSEVEARPEADWLVEIPLLFEKKLENYFDLVVCVSSPLEIAAKRLTEKGYTEARIERRRRRQMALEEKVRRADIVLTNAGSLEFLKQQIELCMKRIRN
ncbi:MAG: dephospho-CoA kinase [Opitutales bacterium]